MNYTPQITELLSKLENVKQTSDSKWSARCPAHDDRRNSLSVATGTDGAILIKCHAGCETTAVVETVGMTLKDLFPAKNGSGHSNGKSGRQIVATYDYRDASGELLFQVCRTSEKQFPQRRPDENGGWLWNLKGVRKVLYRLPELLAADPSQPVFIVEGEKDVERLRTLGLVATCNPGGAGKWQQSYNADFKGRDVVIIGDNDEAGRKHVQQVARSLYGTAATIKMVDLPNVGEKGDVSDWLGSDSTATDLLELVNETSEWSPLSTSTVDEPLIWRPFPVDVLPEPLRGFVACGAKAIGCDPSYLALPLLTALASAIGNTRRVQLKRGWTAPAILWTAIVGESGTAKTPAFKLVLRAVRERQQKALKRHAEALGEHEAEIIHYERALAEWKRDRKREEGEPPTKPEPPEAERCIVSDTTVEALAPLLRANWRGLLLARDELAGWIGSFDRYSGGKGGADAAHWLSMHGGESMVVDRKTGAVRTIYVPQASVSVCGGIQPAILNRALGQEHRDSGLAARLLLSCPPRKAKQWTETDIAPESEEEIAKLVNRLYNLEPTVNAECEPQAITVRLTAKAKTAWTSYYNAHAKEQANLSGALSAAWSKLEEYAARLALVIHFARWAGDDAMLESADKVDAVSMAAGIQLAEWFKREVRRVYGLLGESDEDRDKRRLAEWIERKGGEATAREVQQGHRQYRTASDAEAALTELVTAGYGSWYATPAGPKGGRPSRVFRLLKSSTSTEPPETLEAEGFVDVDDVDAPEIESNGTESTVSSRVQVTI